MKKFIYLLLLAGLPIIAAAQPITSVTAGKDLAMRSIGGSVAATLGPYSTTVALPPSQLVQIVKAANTLNMSFNLDALFPSLGVNSVATATGTSNTTADTITWAVTDTTIAGKTVTIPYNGTNYTVTIATITGSIVVSPALVKNPILDSFDSVYRTETLEPPASNTGLITITGTTKYAGTTVPVTLKFTPAVAGIGGIPPINFVQLVQYYNSNVLGGTTFWCKVVLNKPVTAVTSVALAGSPMTGPTSVSFPVGAQEEFAYVTAPVVDCVKPGHVSATLNGYTSDGPVTILPLLNNLVVSTTPIIGGAPITVRLNFYLAVPAGGVTVNLRSDDPNVIVPASVVVPAGATFYDFVVDTFTPITATTATGVTYLDISASYGTETVRVPIPLH
ncbi:MAG TPA: hypothetical protein VGL56_07985 [Fimbriimonadaceae bacterium]